MRDTTRDASNRLRRERTAHILCSRPHGCWCEQVFGPSVCKHSLESDITFLLQPCFASLLLVWKRRRWQPEERRRKEDLELACRRRAVGLELPWPREPRFGGRKSFGEHYLDELYRATRNDTLPPGVTDKPPHGWRPDDPLTTTLEQLEGLKREQASCLWTS